LNRSAEIVEDFIGLDFSHPVEKEATFVGVADTEVVFGD
jgi:hypothetical protein